jgi:peptide chain release factor subunit 1
MKNVCNARGNWYALRVARITWELLRTLAGVHTPVGPAVSLYLELDPRKTLNWSDVVTRSTSLLASVRAARNGFAHEDRVSLDADVQRIDRFMHGELDREGVRGLALFASSAGGLWEVLPLSTSVRDSAHVDRELYLVPLVAAVPFGEPALVAVVNRKRGSLYRIENGSVEELADLSDPGVPRRHDQGGWSQANYERHVDELAHRHMETVAHAIDRRFRRDGRPPVVVVCPEDERSEVQSMLAADVQAAVVGWTSVEAHAGAPAVAQAVQPLLAQRRAGREVEALRRWRDERGMGRDVARGWEEVLAAASDGRVEELLYDAGADAATGYRCSICRRGVAREGQCPVDGGAVEAVDALNHALLRTLAYGGTAVGVGDRDALDGEAVCARLRW